MNTDSHSNIPRHIAIVMDGNGRWAKMRGKSRFMGHKAGMDAVGKIVKMAVEKKIEVLSLFAFSSENWSRPTEEINYLMQLFSDVCRNQIKKLHEHNICVRFLGDLSRFSSTVRKDMEGAARMTQENTGLKLMIAVNYGGQWDLVQAFQKIAARIASGELTAQAIDAQLVAAHLSTAGLPDPDLLIRTSGEERLSNFYLWQCAYTELYFTKTLWPDFDEAAFEAALHEYANRERRFGAIPQAKSKHQ
ncbi:MAG: isoprenyl transferase [Pseudomonadota bacterium]|nr:isoprenyl transferase [Gammaproteobacteria bacterium]MBU1628535.1 isoprenyl transferase [Gammaproteobacteria bacterium]MBU1926679.1 isoprenyl transferase [Gammaproteobacteria bacterium]MBU2546522.1 isoprenyl transferase [Gammaproteobacteria bacterium]